MLFAKYAAKNSDRMPRFKHRSLPSSEEMLSAMLMRGATLKSTPDVPHGMWSILKTSAQNLRGCVLQPGELAR